MEAVVRTHLGALRVQGVPAEIDSMDTVSKRVPIFCYLSEIVDSTAASVR